MSCGYKMWYSSGTEIWYVEGNTKEVYTLIRSHLKFEGASEMTAEDRERVKGFRTLTGPWLETFSKQRGT